MAASSPTWEGGPCRVLKNIQQPTRNFQPPRATAHPMILGYSVLDIGYSFLGRGFQRLEKLWSDSSKAWNHRQKLPTCRSAVGHVGAGLLAISAAPNVRGYNSERLLSVAPRPGNADEQISNVNILGFPFGQRRVFLFRTPDRAPLLFYTSFTVVVAVVVVRKIRERKGLDPWPRFTTTATTTDYDKECRSATPCGRPNKVRCAMRGNGKSPFFFQKMCRTTSRAPRGNPALD